MPMQAAITMYGAHDCDDTARTRARLTELGILFHEVDIDQDPAAAQFVTFINGGYRSTPTLVIGTGNYKVVLTEPTNVELDAALPDSSGTPGDKETCS